MDNEQLSEFETPDEMLCEELQNEAYYKGLIPQWNFNHTTKMYWIEVNADSATMKKLVRTAEKLVQRTRTIRAAKQALMDVGR